MSVRKGGGGGGVAQSVERATSGEEVNYLTIFLQKKMSVRETKNISMTTTIDLCVFINGHNIMYSYCRFYFVPVPSYIL